jgi:large subunit ribosomal protein L25
MGKAALKVLERKEKARKVRRDGLTPGVIYGQGIEKGIPIKFEMLKLNQLVKGNIKNAKLNVNLGKENMFCIIKEFQRDPVGGGIIHVDMQSVYAEEVIKLKVPVIYSGLILLNSKGLLSR